MSAMAKAFANMLLKDADPELKDFLADSNKQQGALEKIKQEYRWFKAILNAIYTQNVDLQAQNEKLLEALNARPGTALRIVAGSDSADDSTAIDRDATGTSG